MNRPIVELNKTWDSLVTASQLFQGCSGGNRLNTRIARYHHYAIHAFEVVVI